MLSWMSTFDLPDTRDYLCSLVLVTMPIGLWFHVGFFSCFKRRIFHVVVCLNYILFIFTGITSGPYARQDISSKACTELQVTGCITLKKESAASLLAFRIHTRSVSTRTLVYLSTRKAWAAVDDGYYMAGVYRGGCDRLYCIEKIRCCKMYESRCLTLTLTFTRLDVNTVRIFTYLWCTVTNVIIWLGPRADKMSEILRCWLATRAGKMELSCPLGITRSPFARHLKLNPWTMQSFLRFSRCSIGKCFLMCSENSQHLPKEQERDRKSSWGILF